MHQRSARQRKVAQVGAIRPLAIIDAIDHLGDDAVDVQVALAVPMAAQIQRDIV